MWHTHRSEEKIGVSLSKNKLHEGEEGEQEGILFSEMISLLIIMASSLSRQDESNPVLNDWLPEWARWSYLA